MAHRAVIWRHVDLHVNYNPTRSHVQSLATNHGLSAFDERLAYLSPVAYRYMFSGYINKQMKHYQLLDSDKYVEVSRIASDYDVAIDGKYDINIHIDLALKQTHFQLNNS